MTKADFMKKLAELYSIANRGDMGKNERAERFPDLDWVTPDMASTVCRGFDAALESSVFTDDDRAAFNDLID